MLSQSVQQLTSLLQRSSTKDDLSQSFDSATTENEAYHGNNDFLAQPSFGSLSSNNSIYLNTSAYNALSSSSFICTPDILPTICIEQEQTVEKNQEPSPSINDSKSMEPNHYSSSSSNNRANSFRFNPSAHNFTPSPEITSADNGVPKKASVRPPCVQPTLHRKKTRPKPTRKAVLEPITVPKPTRKAVLEPITVPPIVKEELTSGIRDFIKSRQGNAASDVHPALLTSRVYTIRSTMNERILADSSYLGELLSPPTRATNGRSGASSKKKKLNKSNNQKNDDPFSLLLQKKSEPEPVVTRQRLESKKNETIQERNARQLKSLFNKLSTGNFDTIVFQRLLPLIAEYIANYEVEQSDAYSAVCKAIIDAVSNSNSTVSLMGRCCLIVSHFDLTLSEESHIQESQFRKILLTELHNSITLALCSLTTTSVDQESFEMTNFRRDTIRALSDFSWELAARGIVPSKVLRKLIDSCIADLGDEYIQYEKVEALMISARSYFHYFGSAPRQKCIEAWNHSSSLFRSSINSISTINCWNDSQKAECNRLVVLLEIAEAEDSLRDKVDQPNYPLKAQELLGFQSYFFNYEKDFVRSR